ncbi:MAG: AtpZ/AtpI family protein [Rhodospirillales bacterium]|uniref:ATP synthase protein I n=1 Tax=metagenome TaxID=256318 RepID=A0A380T9T5_9ZZZZ|nr:AtpZ/AtpI family protein [Rhodospirillales bacterium]MDG4602822.1 AtpZ/AtpI family protein [Defluviicoccus sp.]MDG4609570.1 AtpZ/AtpI family protein [Defluviicoccus sp.]SUS03514.1 ATP synthase protein I [uncultured Defluviicoccus sp.]HOT83374.1 AtpZ/AtpI family protein [Candidatus Defluviicoccus seviourii]
MSHQPSPGSLQDLDERLRRLRAETEPPEAKPAFGEPANGLGMAFMVAAHLVSGLAVGAGIGYLLDRGLGTKPWLLVTFFLLGAAAGGMNVYRTIKGYGMAVGYHPAPADEHGGRERSKGPTADNEKKTERG